MKRSHPLRETAAASASPRQTRNKAVSSDPVKRNSAWRSEKFDSLSHIRGIKVEARAFRRAEAYGFSTKVSQSEDVCISADNDYAADPVPVAGACDDEIVQPFSLQDSVWFD